MSTQLYPSVALISLFVLAIGGPLVPADSIKSAATLEREHQAVERGLQFLQQDAAKWRKER
jgi:hypothetical protein